MGRGCRLAVLALACVLGVADGSQAQPISVRDAYDRIVTLPTPPQRIIPVYSSNVELVAALGLADRIVGIETFTRYPPEILNRPSIGGRLGISVDATVALEPDLVIVTPARQAVFQLVDPMERLGVPIIILMQRNMAEIFANIRLLGRATGVPDRGETLAASLEARLAKITDRIKDLPQPRVVMIRGRVGNGLLLIAQADTYTGDAIVLAGGRFALSRSSPISQVSPEAIIDSDPDYLLYAGPQHELDDLVTNPGWNEMRAVKTHRAVVVNRGELLIPGPRTVAGVEHLAAIFHPGVVAP
jgi:iron complex transport system substrate-binding protein